MSSQGILTGVVALDEVLSWGKEVWRGRSVLSTGHGGSSRRYSNENKPRHWIRRNGGKNEDLQIVYLLP